MCVITHLSTSPCCTVAVRLHCPLETHHVQNVQVGSRDLPAEGLGSCTVARVEERETRVDGVLKEEVDGKPGDCGRAAGAWLLRHRLVDHIVQPACDRHAHERRFAQGSMCHQTQSDSRERTTPFRLWRAAHLQG
jgi:hypothetical protein